MADEQNPMQGNDATVRTETGEIKNQQATQTSTTTADGSATAQTQDSQAKTSTEAKPADDKSLAAGAKDEKKPAEPGVVPDKYDLKAPEGYEIDPKLVEDATPIFKELGLTQDAAQKLTDLWNKHSLEAANAPYKAYEEMRNGWRDSVAKDPALGNGTDDLKPEVKATIGRGIDSLGPALARDFRSAMDLTGSGDNPAFVKALYELCKRAGEGTAVSGKGPSPVAASGSAPKSAASAMYPNLPSSSAS